MALLFVIQIFFFHAILGKMNGRLFRMKAWVHSLDFEVMGNVVKSDCTVTYLTIIGYFYVFMPFITLILWLVYMLKDAGTNEREYNHKNPVFVGAISIFLLGIAVCLAILAVTKITWNNYRFKPRHLLIFLVAYLSFSSW